MSFQPYTSDRRPKLNPSAEVIELIMVEVYRANPTLGPNISPKVLFHNDMQRRLKALGVRLGYERKVKTPVRPLNSGCGDRRGVAEASSRTPGGVRDRPFLVHEVSRKAAAQKRDAPIDLDLHRRESMLLLSL